MHGISDVLTTTQAADYLGYTTAYIRKLAASGEIVGIKIGPRAWVFDRSHLVAFSKNHVPTTGRPRSGNHNI